MIKAILKIVECEKELITPIVDVAAARAKLGVSMSIPIKETMSFFMVRYIT